MGFLGKMIDTCWRNKPRMFLVCLQEGNQFSIQLLVAKVLPTFCFHFFDSAIFDVTYNVTSVPIVGLGLSGKLAFKQINIETQPTKVGL